MSMIIRMYVYVSMCVCVCVHLASAWHSRGREVLLSQCATDEAEQPGGDDESCASVHETLRHDVLRRLQ